MSEDPTMQLIRDLDDPTKFVRKDRVAVFKPHTRMAMGQDGKPVEIKVDGNDLQEIARNINAAYGADGQLVKLTIGHRKQDPNTPETAQPPIAGYARHYRAEMVQRPDGPQLRLTHVEYIRADRKDILEEGRYPERSPEYDPVNKTITGVALLTRDQYLNLGTVSYSASGRVTYAMGATMADGMDDDKFSPEEEQQYSRMCKYMKMKHPKLAQYMDDMGAMQALPETGEDKAATASYAVGDGSGNQKAQRAAMNHYDPPEHDGDGDVIGWARGKNRNHNSNNQTISYAAIDARLKEIEARNKAAEKALVESQAARVLDKVVDAVKFDYAKELNTLVSLPTDADRQAHVEYMLENYQQLPKAGFIPVHYGAVKPVAAENPITAEQPKRAEIMDYIRSHPGVSYDAAERAILSKN